jgi:hypothetical protein
MPGGQDSGGESQINGDDIAVGIETNILAKESEGLDTGICRDAVDADGRRRR